MISQLKCLLIKYIKSKVTFKFNDFFLIVKFIRIKWHSVDLLARGMVTVATL